MIYVGKKIEAFNVYSGYTTFVGEATPSNTTLCVGSIDVCKDCASIYLISLYDGVGPSL